MKIALYGSIAWRHPFGFGQAIHWARRFGWDCVDARGLSIGVPGDMERNLNAFGYDMLGPRQIRKSARGDLRRQLEDAGTPLSGIYCSSSINLPGDMGMVYRQHFCEYAELAADLGADWVRSINNTVTIHNGTDMMPEEAYERTVEGSREVGRRVAELGIGLLLENNENTVTPDASSLTCLQEDIGDVCRVGIAYDPVNVYFQGHDPREGFDVLRGKIDILHVKNVRRHNSLQWDYMPRGDFSYEWTSLTDGDIDWRQLIREAHAGGFDGMIVFEYVNPFKGMPIEYWDTLREPEEAAREEGEFLRSVLAEL